MISRVEKRIFSLALFYTVLIGVIFYQGTKQDVNQGL